MRKIKKQLKEISFINIADDNVLMILFIREKKTNLHSWMIVYTTSWNWDALYDLRKQSSDEVSPSHVGAARKEEKQNKNHQRNTFFKQQRSHSRPAVVHILSPSHILRRTTTWRDSIIFIFDTLILDSSRNMYVRGIN